MYDNFSSLRRRGRIGFPLQSHPLVAESQSRNHLRAGLLAGRISALCVSRAIENIPSRRQRAWGGRGAFRLELLLNAVQQLLSFAVFVTLRINRAGLHGASKARASESSDYEISQSFATVPDNKRQPDLDWLREVRDDLDFDRETNPEYNHLNSGSAHNCSLLELDDSYPPCMIPAFADYRSKKIGR